MYAHVAGDGTVDQVQVSPPDLVWDETVPRWWDLRTGDPATIAAAGWFPVVEAQRPADTATMTWDATYTFADPVVTQAWAERAKTPEEVTAATEGANSSAMLTNLAQDLVAMQAIIDTTNQDLRADPSQELKDIARMLRRLGRFAIGDLSGTN